MKNWSPRPIEWFTRFSYICKQNSLQNCTSIMAKPPFGIPNPTRALLSSSPRRTQTMNDFPLINSNLLRLNQISSKNSTLGHWGRTPDHWSFLTNTSKHSLAHSSSSLSNLNSLRLTLKHEKGTSSHWPILFQQNWLKSTLTDS